MRATTISNTDQRDKIQKKVFTKWVNKNLKKVIYFYIFSHSFVLIN